jgi:hypothetical protein
VHTDIIIIDFQTDVGVLTPGFELHVHMTDIGPGQQPFFCTGQFRKLAAIIIKSGSKMLN